MVESVYGSMFSVSRKKLAVTNLSMYNIMMKTNCQAYSIFMQGIVCLLLIIYNDI